MKQLKISVIIPIYNAEKYLPNCLQSCFEQSYKNLEIICINDGSTDASKKIVQKFQEENLNLLYLENSTPCGAGFCRNLGIDHASGDYLMFLDSDDMYALNICAEVAALAQKYQPDIIEFPFMLCDENGQNARRANYCPQRPTGKVELKKYWMMYSTSCWNRAFKTNFIKKNNIRNSTIKTGEDNNFTIPAFLKAQSFYFLNVPGYYYRYVPSSLSRVPIPTLVNIERANKVFEILQKDLIRLDVYDEKQFQLMRICGLIWSVGKNTDKAAYDIVRNYFRSLQLQKKDFEEYNCAKMWNRYAKIKNTPFAFMRVRVTIKYIRDFIRKSFGLVIR